MKRSAVIFGNGLGMALDPLRFSLDGAIGLVWNMDDLLTPAQKALICACLPEDPEKRPHSEEDLDTLQLALSACDLLNGIEGDQIHWLSEQGQEFPRAVRRFIYHTALQFHQAPVLLPEAFVQALADFIHQSKSHIGTLNYDNLLYQPLIEKQVLSGYDGALVDGFLSTGFSQGNMERKYGKTFGYYFHLHGSPLFVDRDSSTIKLQQNALPEQTDTVSAHIVLTHVEHKPTVISASEVLQCYWRLLAKALRESERLTLFGYSGCDSHLNALVQNARDLPVRVVEWSGAGDEQGRLVKWREWTGREEIDLIRLDNILEFRQWA